AIEQDRVEVRGRGELPGREPGRQESPFWHPRARDGGDSQRAIAVEAAAVRRDVLHLQRLRAARHPAVGADGAAHHLRVHARRHGRRRRRSHPPAGRAPGLTARHPRPGDLATRGRQRSRGGISLRDAAPAPARRARAVAAAVAHPGSAPLRRGRGGRGGALRARVSAGRQSRGGADRLGQRGAPGRGGSRKAARRGHPLARRLDAVLGDLRRANAGIPGQRAASLGEGSRCGGAGLHVRMGAIRGQLRPCHRHDHVGGFGPLERPAEEVRLRARQGRLRGPAAARQAVTDGRERGGSSPLGAAPLPGGVKFSVFPRHATGVELLLFDGVDDTKPASVVRLDPTANRTYYYWHAFVPNGRPGQPYGYRVEGPFDPSSGMRFDPAKLLLDPYGRGVAVPRAYNRAAARYSGDNIGTAMKSVVVDVSAYDWEGDPPLQRPASRTIVYEMHVRGFTRHPSSGLSEKTRGTFAGLVEKIPYLQRLGVTAVELMPVFQFDPQDSP